MSQTPEPIRNYIDANEDPFQQAVLFFAATDKKLFAPMQAVLCKTKQGETIGDFTHPLYTMLFTLIRNLRLREPNVAVTANAIAFQGTLEASSAAGMNIIGNHEIPSCVAMFNQIVAVDWAAHRHVVTTGLSYWLSKRRMATTLNRRVANRQWDASSVIADVTSEIQFLHSALQPENHTGEFMRTMLTMRQVIVECISTGLIHVDRQWGGGMHRGDGHMVIAAPGVGKTVWGTSCAQVAAFNGFVVAYITTEQPKEQLIPRIISARCNVPFSQIARGFDMSKLDGKQRDAAIEFARRIQNHLFFFDWNKSKESVMTGGLEAAYQHCVEHAGRCDLIVLDWIGGSLTEEAKSDKDKKRLAMQNSADGTASFAGERDLATLILAQAHKKDGTNNPYVGVESCTDCKTMDQKMTTVGGITGMFSAEAKELIKRGEDASRIGLYDPKQFLFTSKSRMGEGGHAPIKRAFGYQRFEDFD